MKRCKLQYKTHEVGLRLVASLCLQSVVLYMWIHTGDVTGYMWLPCLAPGGEDQQQQEQQEKQRGGH